MKRLLVLTIFSLFTASAAVADHIGIYSDATGWSCNLTSTLDGAITNATIIHKFANGSKGVRFKVAPTTGILGINAASGSVTLLGDFRTDLAAVYATCSSGSIAVCNLIALWIGSAPASISIVVSDAYPDLVDHPSPVYFDCDFVQHPAAGGLATINGNTTECGDPLAVESSTWGGVKALYR